jgi:hypothetical protein
VPRIVWELGIDLHRGGVRTHTLRAALSRVSGFVFLALNPVASPLGQIIGVIQTRKACLPARLIVLISDPLTAW